MTAAHGPEVTGPRGGLRIVVHDYSGHPFQVQLSRELARRGHTVLHLHFAGFQTPKAALVRRSDDPPTFAVEAIDLDRPFAKYQLLRRLIQERQLGGILARRIRAFNPDVVMSSNAPLDVQVGAHHAARSTGAAFIFWLQDVYSDAIARHLRRMLPGLGHIAALRFIALERSLLRKADRVVAITDDFRPRLQEWNVEPDRVITVENWAPIGCRNMVVVFPPWSNCRFSHSIGSLMSSGRRTSWSRSSSAMPVSSPFRPRS